ncbi:hypothetical protein L6R29_17355 [Myxococcota bacterium]|nr:hypothetical protein [Myxococcota bacterium]
MGASFAALVSSAAQDRRAATGLTLGHFVYSHRATECLSSNQGQAQVKWGQAQVKRGQAQVKRGQAQVKWGQAQVKWGQAQVKWGQAQVKWGQAQVKWGQAQVKWGQALRIEKGRKQANSYVREAPKTC